MAACVFHGIPDSKVHGANMGPIWGRQDPGGPHVGPMNFAIWHVLYCLGPGLLRKIHVKIHVSKQGFSNMASDWLAAVLQGFLILP